MTDVTSIALAVDSRQVRTATSDLDRFTAAGRRTEGATTKLASSFRGLGGIIGAGTAALAVREIVQAADAYTALNARLRLVTLGSREFEAAQLGVFRIAQQTRAGLGETANLYGSLARSTEALGVSQSDVLGVTETINQALIVSGTSAQSAAAALVQLGQGFASGTLRGEELNSVLEQAPRLARAIADGLGVPIGKLRELGQAGELTADKVFRALQKSAGTVRSEFERIPLTIEGSITQAGNALSKLIGEVDQATGASGSLAASLGEAAIAVGDFASELQRINSGQSASDNVFGVLASSLVEFIDGLKFATAAANLLLTTLGLVGAGAAAALNFKDLKAVNFNAISAAVMDDIKRAKADFDKFVSEIGSTRVRVDTSESDAEFARFRRQQNVAPQATTKKKAGGSKRDPFADAIKGLREQIGLVGQLTELDKVNARIKLGNYGKISDAQKASIRGLAAELDLRQNIEGERAASLGTEVASIKRELDRLTGSYESAEQILEATRAAGLIDEAAYYNAKRGLINLATDAEIAALNAEKQKLTQERASGDERIRNLERIAEIEARIQALRTGQATQIEVLATQQAAAAEKIRKGFEEAEAAAQDYLNTLRRAQEVELRGLGQGNRERGRLQGRAQIEDKFSDQRQRLESERRQGQITEDQYKNELDRIRRFQAEALSSYDAYYKARLEKEANFATGASEALANYLAESENVAAQTERLFTNAFQGMENALVKFVTTGKLDFKSLADSIVADIARIIIKEQLSKIFKSIFDGGGGGFFGEVLGAVLGGGRAIGGPVSAGKIYPINEKGSPEIATFGGRDYLLTGANSGKVKPAETASSNTPAINLVVNQSFSGNVTKTTMDQGASAIGRVARQAMARGTN